MIFFFFFVGGWGWEEEMSHSYQRYCGPTSFTEFHLYFQLPRSFINFYKFTLLKIIPSFYNQRNVIDKRKFCSKQSVNTAEMAVFEPKV